MEGKTAVNYFKQINILSKNIIYCLFSLSFNAADWKYRHAGLMALSAIGEGCHQQMEGILNEIVNLVLLFLQDPVSFFKTKTKKNRCPQNLYLIFFKKAY